MTLIHVEENRRVQDGGGLNTAFGNVCTVVGVASPFDLSALVNMLTQLLPFIIILAILPMVIKLVTGLFKE